MLAIHQPCDCSQLLLPAEGWLEDLLSRCVWWGGKELPGPREQVLSALITSAFPQTPPLPLTLFCRPTSCPDLELFRQLPGHPQTLDSWLHFLSICSARLLPRTRDLLYLGPQRLSAGSLQESSARLSFPPFPPELSSPGVIQNRYFLIFTPLWLSIAPGLKPP